MKTMCFYHRILQNLGLSENFLFMKSLLRKSRSDKKVHNTMRQIQPKQKYPERNIRMC